jgi:hypothetical protein
LNIEAWISRTTKTLNLISTRVIISKTGGCALYLATHVEVNTRRIVDIFEIETEILSIENLVLNMNNCNCAVIGCTGDRVDIAQTS